MVDAPMGMPTLAIAATFILSEAPSLQSEAAGCGLVKWCFSASQLVLYLRQRRISTEAVIVSNSMEYVAANCQTRPAPRTLPLDPVLAAAMRRWTSHLRKQSVLSSANLDVISSSSLAKWQLLSRLE